MTFANITLVHGANTLKITFKIYNWPFFALSNSLSIVLEAKQDDTSNTSACVEQGVGESGSLHWFLLHVGNTSLYGQMINRTVVDGRIRSVVFLRNASDGTISATIPHFWYYTCMIFLVCQTTEAKN
jgi:hypothetical protein